MLSLLAVTPVVTTPPALPPLHWHQGGPPSTWQFWSQVWTSRDLFWFLALRDFQIRYRQAAIGALWAIIQPLAYLAIFTVLFGLLGKKPAEDKPYWLIVWSGLLPWQFFSFVVTQAAPCLVANQQLITKVRFPRQLLPLATLLTASIDLTVCTLPFLIGLLVTGYLNVQIFAAPLFMLLIVITAVGIGLGLSALNAIYRDVGHVLPLMMQILFYITPVVYQGAVLIPERFRKFGWYFSLNPLATGIEGLRWAALGTKFPDASALCISVALALGVLVLGSLYFRTVERTLADRI